MTYVEFYTDDHIENVCSALIRKPDRIFFVCRSRNSRIKAAISSYREFFKARGEDIRLETLYATPYSFEKLIDRFTQIVCGNDEVVFDLSGGDNVYAAAAATVCERHRDRNVQMHRYYVENGRMVDCDLDGKTIMGDTLPQITCVESLAIYGARLLEPARKAGMTDPNRDGYSRHAVETVWKIAGRRPKEWNLFTAVINRSDRGNDRTGARYSVCDKKTLTGEEVMIVEDISSKLSGEGLMEKVVSGSLLKMTWKDGTVDYCLAKQGNLLELYVFDRARHLLNNGSEIYNDALTGVMIDADKAGTEGSGSPENEIDVLLQSGLKPVFISCKNGQTDSDEVYKVKAVARRFGGIFASSALVMNLYPGEQVAESLRKRCKLLDVTLIEVYDLSPKKLDNILAGLAGRQQPPAARKTTR